MIGQLPVFCPGPDPSLLAPALSVLRMCKRFRMRTLCHFMKDSSGFTVQNITQCDLIVEDLIAAITLLLPYVYICELIFFVVDNFALL